MDNNNEQQNTSSDNKKPIIKIIIIVLSILIVIGGIIIGYRYFKSKQPITDIGGLFPTASEIVNIITGNDSASTTIADLSKSSTLVELYKGPVGGYTKLIDKNAVRVFDRTKGLIIDINLDNGEQKTVTDQPILHIHDVTFIGDTSIITRSYEDGIIKSNLYNFNLNQDTGLLSQTDKPIFLSDDILELAKSSNSKYVAFVIKDVNGSNIDLLNTETQEIKRQISLPIAEWIPFVTNDGEVYLSSKASKYADSGTYKIVDKNLNIVVPALTSQTSLISPNGKSVLSTSIYDKVIDSTITKLTDNSDYIISDNTPDLKTISDKCTWNNLDTIIICGIPKNYGNNIPDEWYLGQVEYNDSVIKYDLINGKTEFVFDPELESTKTDLVSLSINGNNLFFKNKLNEHLFIYKFEEYLDAQKDYSIPNTEEITNSATTTE